MNPSTTLRGGMVGCGYFAQFHIEAWRRIPGVELAAAADPVLARARQAAPQAYSAEEMFDGERLDFVDVATRPDSHLPLVRLAAGRKTPVICQKPMAPTCADAVAMVADVNRSGVFDEMFEFLQDDGTSVGSFMVSGLNSGSRPPGAPLTFPGANAAIIGGTGAFLGMRGQASTVTALPGATSIRQASVTEDPSNRRALGGGGLYHLVFHLVPLQRPEVMSVFHSDFTPVSTSSPARAGETPIVSATGLGPTNPGVDPGQPFPATPLQEVNSPLGVAVNGRAAVVLNRVGWPGTTGVYRVDFRVPDGTAANVASVQISAAWIQGPETKIAVQ